jgi:hypothetical protein
MGPKNVIDKKTASTVEPAAQEVQLASEGMFLTKKIAEATWSPQLDCYDA